MAPLGTSLDAVRSASSPPRRCRRPRWSWRRPDHRGTGPIRTPTSRIDLHITVPGGVIGTTAKVRVYLALEGLALAPITEVAVGARRQLQVVAGPSRRRARNDFTATVVADGAESPEAPVVTLVLDQEPPKITIASPKQNATINDATVTIKGSTQARCDLLAHNQANGTSVTARAAADGTFTLVLPIDQGANASTSGRPIRPAT